MKITITADAYALTSDLTVENIELLKKYNPDALKIKDKEGNDKFSVSYTEGKPCIQNFGITFGGKSRGEDAGKATITGMIPVSIANAKEFVAELFGNVVANLKEMEKTIPEAAKEVAANKKALLDDITVG